MFPNTMPNSGLQQHNTPSVVSTPNFVHSQENVMPKTSTNSSEKKSKKVANSQNSTKLPKTPDSLKKENKEEKSKRKYTPKGDNKKLLKDLLGKQENEDIEIKCKHCKKNFKLSDIGVAITKRGNNTFQITCPHPDCQRHPSYEFDTQAKKLKPSKIKHQKYKKNHATPEEKANYISEIGKTHPCGRCGSQNISRHSHYAGKQRLMCNFCKYDAYKDTFSIPVPPCPKGHSNENVTGIPGPRAEGKLNWHCKACDEKWSTYNVQTPAAEMHDDKSDSSSSSEDSE